MSSFVSRLISQLVGRWDRTSQLRKAAAVSAPASSLLPRRAAMALLSASLLGFAVPAASASSKNPRRFYRIDATGVVQRGPSKVTQVHIRGVWNTQSYNANPLCTNHPSCNKGTWMYFRID